MSGNVRYWLHYGVFTVVLLVSFSTFTIPAGAGSAHQSAFRTGTVDVSAEADFLNRTNSLRASLGLPALRSNSELTSKARSWSQTQADAGTIFHSTLTDGVTQNWHRLGENVGMGPDVVSIHDALVRSPRHYENLADSGFTEVGIGVVRQGNAIYVSQVFIEFMASNNTNQQSSSATQAASPKKTSYASPVNRSSGQAASIPVSQPIAESVPLKTASPDLSEVIEKLSILES